MEIRPILSTLRRSKTGAILVAGQVALTLAIICNALFVVQTRLATASRPSGVDDEGAVFEMLYIGAGEIADPREMQRRDLEVLRGIPGVTAAAAVNQVPMGRSGWGNGLSVDPTRPGSTVWGSNFFSAESLIDVFGFELIEGRQFEESEIREVDSRTAQLEADSVILSRHLARQLFPDQPSVVGKTVYFGTGPSAHPMQVVGVVDTMMGHMAQSSDEAFSSFIMPVRYFSNVGHYAVRTDPAQRSRIMADAEKALSALRTDRAMLHNRTMDEIRENAYRTERSGASMLVAVTIGLLVVTASGIVGIASLWVSQRKKQIGVRRALGARRGDIVRYFLTENVIITTGGIAAGLALAVGLNQLLVSRLELARLPVPYLVGGVIAVWALGILSVLGPAWRAASVPPATATRSA